MSKEEVNVAPANPAGEEAPDQVEALVEVDEAPKMGLDEFYPEGHVEKPKQDSALSRRSMKFFQCYGQPSYKRYNYHWLGGQDFIYATGNTYQIFNLSSGYRKIFHGTDTDGIGSITVHPSLKYFAVGEKGTYPNVYIYEWPSLKLYRVCRKGTDKMFAHVEFSASGDVLASLGGSPDYTLTVWDWIKEKVILKSKAFSQEVFRVSFSPYTDDILTTCGAGHIRFWKMAQTFTGLKLQGEIAKFGQLELSDIASFYELPDGKVVSGTEYGTLIVWEGQFVKAQLLLDAEKKTPLHQGMIEVLLRDGEFYVTAGEDGYIKWWKISDIDTAEADEGYDVSLLPVREILISSDPEGRNAAHIVQMIPADGKWFIQDAKGHIYQMGQDSENFIVVQEFQQGGINSVKMSPTHNYAITIGENGCIKVWDYARKSTLFSQIYSGAGTCLEQMAHSDQNKGRVCAAGFDNGIVRILSITSDGVQILKAFKAHDHAIAGIKYSQDLKVCVTASVTGDVFFFDIDGQTNIQKYDPICTLKLPDNAGINDFRWSPDDQSVIFGCNTGFVYQIRRPKPNEIDNSDSYFWENPDIKVWRIKIMEFQMAKNQKKDEAEEEKKRRMRLRGELPPEENEPEEDWAPEPIRTIVPLRNASDQNQFIVSSQGKFNGFIYLCSLDSIRPLKAIPIQKGILITFMELFRRKGVDILAIGYEDGNVEIVLNFNYEKRLSIKYHDAHLGAITGVTLSSDDQFLMTSGADGLLYVHQFDKLGAIKELNYEPLAGVEGANFLPSSEREALFAKRLQQFYKDEPSAFNEINEVEMGLDEAALSLTLKSKEPINMDILDPSQYSIQQAKLRTEEDHRLSLAEKKKEKVRIQINNIRQTFQKILDKNNSASSNLQITEDDLQIDPEYFQILYDRNELKISETNKEVAWGIEYHTVNLNKLKNAYYDLLEFEKFTVKGVVNGAYVTTFRVQKMSEFLQTNIEAFKQMLENEIIGKDAENDEDFQDDASNKGDVVDDGKQKLNDKAAILAQKQKAALQAALNAKKTEAEKKREQRKIEREERKKAIDSLVRQEAQHSGEDPEDTKKIEQTLATFGNYNLKISDKYIVPENQRVNFSKKRQQMVLLEGSIHKLKVDFNQKIQELKVRKQEIVDHSQTLNVRIEEINKELGIKEELFHPQIDKNLEYPENFFEIKDEDIEQFKVKKAQEEAKKKGKGKGAGKGKGQKEDVQEAVQEDNEEESVQTKKEQAKVDLLQMKVIPRKNAKVQNTDLDSEFAQIRKIELSFEKETKQKEINDVIKVFDEEIREMQKEKYRLESDLKNAEMKLIIFFEELILLKSMESKDILLTKRLAYCRQEKGKILKEINEISRSLKDKKKDIEIIKEKDEQLQARFKELCPENSDQHEKLRKFYETVIKRKKRVDKIEKGEGEDNDEDDDAEVEEDEPEEEDEDEEGQGIGDLNPNEYKIEDIEKLREERLDLVEDKEKILQYINELEASRKRLEQKERTIKADLEETEEEIQDFQSEKMAKLNQLQISVVLKVKQIQNLLPNQQLIDKYKQLKDDEINRKMEQLQKKNEGIDDPAAQGLHRDMLYAEEDWRGYVMAENLKTSILFTRTQLLQLINRQRELDIRIDEENAELVKMRVERKEKLHEIKLYEQIKEQRQREYNERQMLRFGNLIDLENLEVQGPSALVLDLKNKFTKNEKMFIKSIEDSETELEKTQRELTAQMKNNTNLLNLIRNLGEEELDLDKKLNDSNKAIFVDEDDEKKKHILQEKMKIKKLLEIQAKEIETFKTEINMYKRKGGHIYTKVTTNRRVANLNQDN